MGIEVIGSIGRIASVAPAVGRGASFGPIGRVGPLRIEGIFSVTRISNPFKAEAPKPQFKVADVIAEAERIVAVAKKPAVLARRVDMAGNLVRMPEPMVVRLPNPTRGLDVRVFTNPQIVPKVEVRPQIRVEQATDNRPATRAVIRSATRPEVQTQQVVKERKVTKEQKKEDATQEKKTEKQFMVKTTIVEALKVSQLRRSAISEAVQKVKEEDEKTGEKVVITAKKLKKFLLVNFWKYISPLVEERGYDGTIPLTLKAIENNQTEYTNVAQAQAELSKPVTEHIPLQQGEGGRIATVEEVKEVLEGKQKEILRSNTLAEIVITREVTVNNVEPTLKDLGLEELFQKAA